MSLLRSIFLTNCQRRTYILTRSLRQEEREFTDIEKKLHRVKQQRPEDRSFFDRHFLSVFAVCLGGILVFWNHIQQFPELHRTRDNHGAWVPTPGVPASALLERAKGQVNLVTSKISEKISPASSDNSSVGKE